MSGGTVQIRTDAVTSAVMVEVKASSFVSWLSDPSPSIHHELFQHQDQFMDVDVCKGTVKAQFSSLDLKTRV